MSWLIEYELHLTVISPIIFRVASVYFDAYSGKRDGFPHMLFQVVVVIIIVGYSIAAALFIAPTSEPIATKPIVIMDCSRAGITYGPISNILDPVAVSEHEHLLSMQNALDQFCERCKLMQAWLYVVVV